MFTPSGAVAQELNAIERAAPCKVAGEQAEQKINGTLNVEAYKAVLADLNDDVENFVVKTGETEESSLHCLNYYGAALLRLGELGEASQVYRRAAEIARKNFGPDDDSTLTLQGNLAVALMRVGSLPEAESLQKDTLAHRESLDGTPKAHKLAITLLNLAMIESAMGKITDSREVANRGWSLAQKSISTNDQRWSTVLDDYGMVLDQAGSRSEAQTFFEQALAVRLKDGDEVGAVESLASLAASFYDVGRIEEADRRYEEAYNLAKHVLPPLHPTLGQIARSWCRVLSSISKLEESLVKCDEALNIQAAHADSDKLEMYLTQVNRGITLGELGRKSEAINTLQAALTGLKTDFPAYTLEVFEAVRSLGVVLVDADRVGEGAALLADALKWQTAALGEMHPEVLLTQGNYGVVLALEGKLQEAEAVLTDYAKKADVTRGLYGGHERTTRGVFSRFAATRMFLAKVLISEDRCQAAFDWLEETKARSLRDRIRDHVAFGAATAEDKELFSALNQTRTRLYMERAKNIGNGAAETEIDTRLRTIDDQVGRLIEKTRTREIALRASAKPSSEVVQSVVKRDTTVAAFGIVENEVLVTTYRGESGFQCTSLGQWDGLNETLWATHLLQSTIGGLSSVLAGNGSTPASRIIRTGPRSFAVIPRAAPIPQEATIEYSADELLDTVGKGLMGWLVSKTGFSHRLVLSPDGLLSVVALDALRINGQPLINRFSMSQVDSFAPAPGSLYQLGGLPRSQTMVAFGDPVYSSKARVQSVLTATRSAELTIRGNIDEIAEWPPLPASGPELHFLATLYKMVPGETVFAKDLATVQNLERLNNNGILARTRFVVFSAHAFADVSDPELSSIVLSVPAGGKQRDAYLTATEIASLSINSDLVFFSACETGFGQVVTGEGVLSLSSAALVAGAHATVHTLWSVADTTSAEFTKRFFTAIRDGMSPEQALTRTKRAFIRERNHAPPAYWAPYVLVQPQL